MEQNNKYMVVAYKMQTTNNDETIIEEEATRERPFKFITGFGMAMPAFEAAVKDLSEGETFDFSLTCEEAFGPHADDHVLKLDKQMFVVDGRFDDAHIRLNAIVPLRNEDGVVFPARVLEIADDHVTMDLNHPLAGKDLHFVGEVIVARQPTNEEIQTIVNSMSGEGCGCGGCGGGCGEGCGGKKGGCGGGCH